MPTAPRVSVVVPVRDAERGVAALLERLAAQTYPDEGFEVVVVDDGSRDATAEVAAASGFARVERLSVSRGSYVARNRGLAASRAPVVAFTDGDCRPRPDWLERGMAALDGGGPGLVAGRIAMQLSPRPSLAETIDVARGLDQRRCVEDWGFAATANVFVRRAVFEAIGPFNERLRSGGDDELSRRAVAAGFGLAYADDAVVDHVPRRTARAVARKAFRVGHGGGRLRHVGTGPSAQRPRLWSDVRAWRPRHGLLGAERVLEQGADLTGRRGRLLDCAQWALVQVPTAVGDLAADVEALMGRRP